MFIDIILPVPVEHTFTYQIDEELLVHAKPGSRVIVPFGKSKLCTGIVDSITETAPEDYVARDVSYVFEEAPIVTEQQIKFWKWIAKYYSCKLGEVLAAALPSGLLISSETKVVINDVIDQEVLSNLNDKEYLVYEALSFQNVLTYHEISEILGIKTIHPVLKSLSQKNIIYFYEELHERYKPKMASFIRLNVNESSIEEILKDLSRAPKQQDVLLMLVSLAQEEEGFSILKSKFLKIPGISASALKALIDKGLIDEEQIEVGRLKAMEASKNKELHGLSEDQDIALQKIENSFKDHNTVLFKGVTGSGKTEVYFHLIEKHLKQNKQVLYLLPEIALTAQMVKRLQNVFGKKVGIYHSKYSNNERVEVWNKLLEWTPDGEEGYQIVLGARSSIFLPFKDLGLIIVDEEHEGSYKQHEPSPRYHARDMAIVLANEFKAKTLLGSATPSIETYFNAHKNKYGFVDLEKRFGGIQLPEILVADIGEDKRKKRMHSIFSPLLYKNIEQALENKEQVILFQNRRGFAPMFECQTCGNVPKCKRCDVSLTYHKNHDSLRCHYCGYSKRKELSCVACGSVEQELVGFGTQKIEEEVLNFFPKAKVSRMDLDTTRAKDAYRRIIGDFENGEIDILVGTQMVSKGLDFDNVAVVGVLNADQMLNYPDFRAHEKAFQLLAQVAGRSGRKKKRGKVIIQSYNPNHNIIRYVIQNDFESLYQSEMLLRRNYNYPPFNRLIRITLKHQDINIVNLASNHLKELIEVQRKTLEILGPEFPSVSRIRGKYIKFMVVKIGLKDSVSAAKQVIHNQIIKLSGLDPHRRARVIVDVDPY